MKSKIIVCSALCLWACMQLLSCATALTSQGALVKVLAKPDPQYCQPITTLTAQGSSRADAESQMRNQAGEHHATAIHIEEAVDGAGKVQLTGKAYGCRSPAPHEQDSASPLP